MTSITSYIEPDGSRGISYSTSDATNPQFGPGVHYTQTWNSVSSNNRPIIDHIEELHPEEVLIGEPIEQEAVLEELPTIEEELARTSPNSAVRINDNGVISYEQRAVALYGVAPITPTPISGGVDLSVSKAKIEENISILKKASSTLKDTWQSKTKDNLATIQNSWAGPDCESYINNVNSMDKKVNATISALDLLTQTYQKALDLINENQSRVMNVINR